jgi:plasmid stability protein
MAMLQIRDVPEDLHRELKCRAALAGMSVSHYLLMEDELLRRLSKRAPVRVRPTPADAVRAERARRADSHVRRATRRRADTSPRRRAIAELGRL